MAPVEGAGRPLKFKGAFHVHLLHLHLLPCFCASAATQSPLTLHVNITHTSFYFNIRTQIHTSHQFSYPSAHRTTFPNTASPPIHSHETLPQIRHHNGIDSAVQQRSRPFRAHAYGFHPRRKTKMYRLRFLPRPRKLATRRDGRHSQDVYKVQSESLLIACLMTEIWG